MTLVIKNKNVSLTSGEKLYRDALVSDGTIYLIDFSNRGTLNNFSVKDEDIVKDLSREALVHEGLNTQGFINTNNENSTLDDKKGFTAEGIEGAGAYGVVIPDVMDYLSRAEVQNHNILFNLWINTGTSDVNRVFARTWMGGSDWDNTAFRCNISNLGNATFTIGGAIVQKSGIYPPYNEISRCAYLYQGVGNPIKVWINGVYKGETTQLATGFSADGAKIVIGKPEISNNGNQTLYRMSIEDLTVSGRDADEVIQKDYNYVNQLGEYLDKPTKRPYSIV